MQRTLALLVLLIAGWAVPGTVSARTATGSSARASAPAARAAGEYVPLEAGTTYKAYFDNSLYGWENVCIYMWDSQTGYEIFGGWYGEPVTDVEVIGGKEYYVKSFTPDTDISLPMIIFNDYNGNQTFDMDFYDGGVYNADSELIDIFENPDSNMPKAPRFSRASGEFYQAFILEITDLNEPPATIYYTLDGSEPSATNGQKYTSGINIAAGSDVTVKAVAVTETGTSSVVTANYRFVSKHLLTVKIPNKNAISNLYLSSDAEYGEFNTDGSMYITDGMTVYVGYYLNSGYVCNSVKLGGVSYDVADRYFDFQMPASDTELEIITEYNPSSPSDPQPGDTEKKYTLTLVCNPTGAGSLSGAGTYAAETSVYVSTSPMTGYVFTGWTMDGETVTTDRYFYMGMPSSDVVLTANYVYNPSSPSDPDQPRLRHPLTATASPSGSGSFSTSGTEVTFGDEYYVYAYPQTGYKFKGWIVNGVAQEEKSTTLRGVMTDAGAHVVGLFVYDPSSPTNPGANYYNPTTGQVIIDDFTPDYLYNALVTVLAGADFDNVSSIIVKGQMTYGDFGTLRNLKNASTIDLSRVGGTTVVPGYAFQDMAAANISLSSAITEIGSNAFYRCQNLVSLTVYAQEPPACNSSTFSNFTNKENCTVFVPASAIELYSNAPYWKDFTIMPITNDAHVLQVNLPADAADGRYKHNSLEIVNINSGIRQKYVVSDRMLYTFNGLQKDEQYNIYMLSQAGLEIGRIENVVMPDHDLEVTFDNMKTLHSVYAKVLDTDGKEVTDQTTVEWLKPLADGTVTYLRKAVSLGEVPEGQNLICRVTLGERLGTAYPTPDDVEFTVSGADNTCEITLAPFRTIALSGTIVDGDGAPISGASVSASQTMNGRFSKTYTAKTDRQGKWSVAVLDAPETRMTYAATECVNVNDTIGAFEANVNALDLGTKTLRSIVGARVNYGFTYKAAGVEEIENTYADYQNVAVSVYNVTQDRAHNEVSLQYPVLAVLDENINAGDELRLTATSKTGAFNPIVKTVTVDDSQRAEVTFDIVGKGGISASFEMTDNPAVTAMLYGSNGELAKKMAYTEAKALFTELEDGEYTLITMGQSDLMNSILRLANYAEIGLTEGKDYVKNTVTVETGKLAEVRISEVPAFDESLFYYTGNTTGFSANKSSITTGGYLTLRANIDFKGVYKNDVSNVALVVDLPEACDFVEQSVVQGPNLLPYTFDNKRLTVQLGDSYNAQTRFCVIPTDGGEYVVNGYVSFVYAGRSIVQPLGSAVFNSEFLTIEVNPVATSNVIPVSGTAYANAKVEIFDNGVLVGQTKALSSGRWTQMVQLQDSQYECSYHLIDARFTMDNNIVVTSAKEKVTFNKGDIEVKSIDMIFGPYEINFDFESFSSAEKSYTYPHCGKDFTFIVNFNDNDSTAVSNVKVNVLCMDQSVEILDAIYAKNLGRWIAYGSFPSSSRLPISCNVDFEKPYKPFDDSVRAEEEYANIEASMQEIEDYADENLSVEVVEDNVDSASYIIKSPMSSSDWKISAQALDLSSVDLSDGFFYIEEDACYMKDELVGDSHYIVTVVDDETAYRLEMYKDGEQQARPQRAPQWWEDFSLGVDVSAEIFVPFYGYVKGVKYFDFWVNEHYPFVIDILQAQSDMAYHVLNAKCSNGTYRLSNELMQKYFNELQDIEAYKMSFYDAVNAKAEVWSMTLRNAFLFESLTCGFGKVLKAIPHAQFFASNGKGSGLMRYVVKGGLKKRQQAERIIDYGYEAAIKGLEQVGSWTDFMDYESAQKEFKDYLDGGATTIEERYSDLRARMIKSYKSCFRKKDEHKNKKFPKPYIKPVIDPAGFVYEAVPENRVEGVQATIYYKETKEDMYGDLHEEIVLWNAEEYAQNNPLFTDENGMYRWDVPQGLWQVKFEKDGYVTAYSEWLPVPPPQLEVNIGIVQNRQPEITEARAYEEGVEVQFDKYMDLSTLTTDNIYVTANGEKLNGEIRMIDSALADEYASEEDPEAVSYASRVRFVPEQALSTTTGEVRLTVSRNVLSYAGIPMTETFSQVLDVEKEVQTIYADDVKVLYGGAKEVTVFAVPFDAAAGRTLRISNSSDLIASIDATEAVLDAEGKAVVVVTGGIPGRTQLNFTIDDVTATGSCAVDVVTEIITAEAPKASRASGTAVYRGTKVELTTESKNGVIWFTTDGSCPCDANGTRRKYTVPIIINDDTKILAMTSVGDNESDVSETAEFNYTLKRSDMEFQMAEGWTWMSHNFYDAIAPADLISDENVSRILSQTREVIRDPQLGMVGTLTELTAPESYKVETTAATVRQRHSDVAWNPATPIALSAGWNWLGYPAGQTMTVDEAFATTEAEALDVIVGQNGFAQFDGENWVGTLETMSPGMGYMYQSQSAKDVVYNTTIVSNASARHATGITGNTPLVLDIHKYGVIMPVVATLSGTDGSMLENEDYQVAAFCGSECRGIGRVVNGLVMMNVYGAVNDPITFSVTDADGELGFSTDTSIDFSETVVGDIYNPFVVTINNGNGISDVTYGGNILVTVENDMLRIRGIAAEDIELVEVYDIDGRKLIRETYVTESGIRISGLNYGAYVVIVKGNGEYTYHKIAVR